MLQYHKSSNSIRCSVAYCISGLFEKEWRRRVQSSSLNRILIGDACAWPPLLIATTDSN